MTKTSLENGGTISRRIILKLDDLTCGGAMDGNPVSPRRQRIVDFIQQKGLKASFGIICWSLEEGTPAYFDWIKKWHDSGTIEMWFHGFRNKKDKHEPGEFDFGTAEEQRAIMEKSQRLAREKLGFSLRAFGEHWSGTTEETEKALQATPEIEIWLCGRKNSPHYKKFVIEKIMALEEGRFDINAEKVIAAYQALPASVDTVILEGHPNAWVDERWENFTKVIAFLQAQGCVFITPSAWQERSGRSPPLQKNG